MKLLLLLPYEYDSAPSQRYRWEQWERELTRQGVQVSRLHFSNHAMGRMRRKQQFVALLLMCLLRFVPYMLQLFCKILQHDVVVVHRNAALFGPPIPEWLVKAMGKKLVFDFDDAIYLRAPDEVSAIKNLLRCDWRIEKVCKWAWAIGAGNADLAEWAKQHNANVFVWPTTIDTRRYCMKEHEETPPVIGWTGSHTTSLYIRKLLPALAQLQQEIDFHLLIVGCEIDLAGAGVKGECVAWTSETELELVQRMDIGLMPLDDTPWERGKCSLKALQYQAAGVPAVVSNVGTNKLAVKDDETGILVPVGGDWKAPLKRLLADKKLRQQMGVAAQKHVQQHYSAQVVSEMLLQDMRKRLKEGAA